MHVEMTCAVPNALSVSTYKVVCLFCPLSQAAKSAGGPTRVEKAKIGLIQFHISPPKSDIENNVVISDYAQVGACRTADAQQYIVCERAMTPITWISVAENTRCLMVSFNYAMNVNVCCTVETLCVTHHLV